MKRMSKAEETLSKQWKRLEDQVNEVKGFINENNVRLATLLSFQSDLTKEITSLRVAREKASEKANP